MPDQELTIQLDNRPKRTPTIGLICNQQKILHRLAGVQLCFVQAEPTSLLLTKITYVSSNRNSTKNRHRPIRIRITL
jgi:hypothetical protein